MLLVDTPLHGQVFGRAVSHVSQRMEPLEARTEPNFGNSYKVSNRGGSNYRTSTQEAEIRLPANNMNGAAGHPVPRVHPLVLPSGIEQLPTARESPHSSGAPLGFFSASAVEHLGAPQLGLQADAGVLGGPSARGSTPVARKVRTDKEARTRPYNKTRCPHGRDPYSCRDCGGAGICEHKRRKSQVCILPFVNILVGVTRL